MDAIIVTVTDRAGTFRLDMELPTNRPAALLKEEMSRILGDYAPGITGRIARMVNARTDREIADQATLEMAGVWNGDYIIADLH